MVARAWTDPAYRALMLEDGTKAAEAMGIPMRGMPPLGVLENTSAVHNLIVCTLCSCYPAILIMAKTLVKVGR
jgi:nitrile hydratase